MRRDIKIAMELSPQEENNEGVYQSDELSPLSLLGKCLSLFKFP